MPGRDFEAQAKLGTRFAIDPADLGRHPEHVKPASRQQVDQYLSFFFLPFGVCFWYS